MGRVGRLARITHRKIAAPTPGLATPRIPRHSWCAALRYAATQGINGDTPIAMKILQSLLVAGSVSVAIVFGAVSPVSSASLPADIDRALKAAVARADEKVLSATVVDAIGNHPALVSEIVRAAARMAPAYSIVMVREASAAYPAFATRIASAAAHSTPETARTIKAVTVRASQADEGVARPVPAPGAERNGTSNTWPGWDASLGFGFSVQPIYEGHDEYEIAPVPLIDVTWRNRLFLTTRNNRGLGVNMVRSRQTRAGAYVSLDWGREEDDANRLNGTGDIEISPLIGLFGEYFPGNWRFSGDMVQGLNRDGQDGMLLTFVGEYGGNVSNRLAVSAEASANYGGENYMRTYFGVNSNQSARSGHTVFLPDAGFKDITGAVNFHYTFSEHWFGEARAEWKRLIGDADTSPLVDPDAENQVSAGIVAGYRF